MATRTTNQMVNRALSIIGVASIGNSVSAEDYELAAEAFETLMLELEARHIVYIPNREEIDLRYFEPLAQLLAQRVSADFGAAQDMQKIALNESLLLQMTPVTSIFSSGSTDYF